MYYGLLILTQDKAEDEEDEEVDEVRTIHMLTHITVTSLLRRGGRRLALSPLCYCVALLDWN